MGYPGIKKIKFDPAPRAAQVVKISLSKEEVSIITRYLDEVNLLTDNPRDDVEGELQMLISDMIRTLDESGGWFGG